jgi:hypothetical protein
VVFYFRQTFHYFCSLPISPRPSAYVSPFFASKKLPLSVLPKMPRPKRFKRVLYAESSASSNAGNPQMPSTSVVLLPRHSGSSRIAACCSGRWPFRLRSSAVPKPSWLRSASGGWPFRPCSADGSKKLWSASACSGGWPFRPVRRRIVCAADQPGPLSVPAVCSYPGASAPARVAVRKGAKRRQYASARPHLAADSGGRPFISCWLQVATGLVSGFVEPGGAL